MDAEGGLQQLRDGNLRFQAGRVEARDVVARRSEVAAAQHQYAAVLACADSRVAPEAVFDARLGELFVVRTAGHVADEVAIASLRFAVRELGVPIVVVLGHTGCGAVAATLAVLEGASAEGLGSITSRIAPAFGGVSRGGRLPVLPDAAVAQHAQMTAALVRDELGRDAPGLRVEAAVYDLLTGAVGFLGG